MKRHAVIIGAGIHGLSCALELCKRGVSVTIVEKNMSVLTEASRGTHNRAHIGYHYPRSKETAKECTLGLDYFIKTIPECLVYWKEFYYVIEKDNSKVNRNDFIKFCDDMKLPFEENWPSDDYLYHDKIDSSFLVPEPCFDLLKVKNFLLSQMETFSVDLIFGFEVCNAMRIGRNSLYLENSNDKNITVKADIIINATYAFTSNVQRAFDTTEELTEYYLQTTEVVVAQYDGYLPALTVMDGPFITILPNIGYDNEYLVYDVNHSVLDQKNGYYYYPPSKIKSNWSKMVGNGRKYFPFMDKLIYKRSIIASRPIPIKAVNDSRKTRFLRHENIKGLYSILEGKFISAPLAASLLINSIENDGIL
jgi:hypothetical protein